MYFTDTLSGIDRYEWQVIPSTVPLTASDARVWLDMDRTAAGWDTLVLIGHHVCGQTTPQRLPLHVTIGLGVGEVLPTGLVRVFPNPAQGTVTMELPSFDKWENPRWMLCDMQGRVLDGGAVDGLQTRIRLENQPRGVYIVRVVSSGSLQCSVKIVKY
jgi:hypothetical protein